MQIERFNQQYSLKAKLVFAFVLLLFFIRFISSAMLSQTGTPPLLFKQSEWAYRALFDTGLLKILTRSFLIVGLFDALLFFLPVVFMFTLKRRYAVAFTCLATIYYLAFNIVTGHHYHGLVGLLVIVIPFLSKNENRFNLLWDGARYYLLYIFVSAALWKIMRGSAFYPEQMVNILKGQQLDMLLQQPASMRAGIARYLITHPDIAHGILMLNVGLQLSFAVGFFTKKADDILLALFILFVIANYFVMGIVSSELLILGITLLSFKRLRKLEDMMMSKEEEESLATA